MSNTLRGKRISDSYQKLVQIVDGEFYDGSGNTINLETSAQAYTVTNVTASFTLLPAHVNSVIEAQSSLPLVITAPSSGIPTGSRVIIVAGGTGAVSVTGASGTSVYSAQNKRTLQNQYSVMTMIKKDSTSWYIFGDLV